LQQLQLLPGIGPKMAERVLQYRKEHGVFRSPEEIMEVKGIGPKKFEKLRPYLRV
jgi:competence protein ComEA